MRADCPITDPAVHSASLPDDPREGGVYQCKKYGHLYKVKSVNPLKLVPLSKTATFALIEEGTVQLKLRKKRGK